VNKRTPRPRDGLPPRAGAPWRRDGDRGYGLAFLLAVEVVRRSWIDRIVAEGEAATYLEIESRVTAALRGGMNDVMQAASQAEAVLAEQLREVRELFDDLARAAASALVPIAWPGEGLEVGAALLAKHGGGADELTAFAVAYEDLKARGAGAEGLAQFTAACGFLKERGGDAEELGRFVCAYRLFAPDEARLASFLGAYRLLKDGGGEPWRTALLVAVAISEGRCERVVAAAVHDRASAMLAAEAYLEASALLTAVVEWHQDDFARALLPYYLGRRTGEPGLLGDGRGRLLHGSGESGGPDGSIYRLGWEAFEGRPETDRELATTRYCEAFLAALEKRPVEVLLKPWWAIDYAKVPAEKKGSETIPPRAVQLSSVLQEPGARDQRIIAIEEADDADEGRPSVRYRDVPGFDVAVEVAEEGSLSPVAAERGITKQAVHKQLKKLRAAAREFEATGSVPRRRSKLDEAKELLREPPEEGRTPAEHVRAEADRRGISQRTLERARQKLGFSRRKRDPGLGRGPAPAADTVGETTEDHRNRQDG